jgi:hypothetical protein
MIRLILFPLWAPVHVLAFIAGVLVGEAFDAYRKGWRS